MTYLTPYTTRRNVFELPTGFGNLEQQLDSLFGGLPGLFESSEASSRPGQAVNAKLRWYEKPDAYLVRVDLPGVSKGDVAIELEEGVVQVSAKRQISAKDGEKETVSSVEYRKSFRVPEGVKEDRIAAGLENGVLSLTLPKSEKVKPRQISVK